LVLFCISSIVVLSILVLLLNQGASNNVNRNAGDLEEMRILSEMSKGINKKS